MSLLNELKSIVTTEGSYSWDDVYQSLNDEIASAIYGGDTTNLIAAIAAEFPLLPAVTTALATDAANIVSSIDGASASANSLLVDGSFAMEAALDMGGNGLSNVASISGSVFIDDDSMASASSANIPSAESVKAYVDAIDTDAVAEAANLYYTNARAIAAPLTGYSAGAGSLSAADSILAGLQKVDGNVQALETTNVAEGTNLYATNARSIAATLTGYSAGAGTVSAADSILSGLQKVDGNLQALATTNVAEGTNLYYTDARPLAAPLTGYSAAAGTVSAADSILAGIQKVDGNLQARVYGTELNLFCSAAVTTHTSDVMLDKINATTSSLPIGTYKVFISYNWNKQGNAEDFIAEAQFDGANLGQDTTIHRVEPKDQAGNWNSTGSNQRRSFSQSYYVDVVSAGTKAVVLRFASELDGRNVSMWDAAIEIIRVS